MSRRRRSKWPWIFVLAAAGGGGWWWWDQQQEKKAVPIEYEKAKVTVGDISKVVRASGDVNPLSKVEIGSQISGTIMKLHVDFNSKVKAGDILCQLDPATYDAAYAQASAERTSAEADCDYQKKTLERKRQLMEKQLFPQADYDKAEADMKGAQAQLQLAEARLKKAKVDLERCTIYAPIDGVIIDRTAEIGQTIAASFNAPKLFILANDLTKMQINAKVSEADIGQVQVGQKVKFTVDAYAEAFDGEVVQVRNSPISEENVVNYDAIIAVNNAELKLKPGMTAVVQIVTAERFGVLRVPNAALRFQPSSPKPGADAMATKKERDQAEAREDPAVRKVHVPAAGPLDEPRPVSVRTGITDGVQTEVVEGLKEGDEVITLAKPPPGAGSATNPFGGMGRR